MRRVVAAYCLFFAGACAGPLPPLPALDEQVPSRVSILGIQPAGGGEILSPEALVVGGVYQLEGAVYSATNQALAGEPLVLSVETASFEELVRFPRGATCVTPTGTEMNAQRTCVIVFRLVGPVADIVLQLRAQRALNVIDEMPLVPLADRASASVRLIAPGIGSRVWLPGDSDPLVGVGPLPISMEDDEPTALWVILEDRFGNPLVGERVELRRWRSVQDLSDSPVSAGDAGADGSFDAGSAIDGQRPAFDAANSDLGLMDAAASDGPRADAAEGMDGGLRPAIDASSRDVTSAGDAGDAGGEITLGQGYFELVTHRDGRCGASPAEASAEQLTAGDGRALFCLQAGDLSGPWKIVVVVPDIAPKDQILGAEQDGFVLDGITRTGDPARLEVWGHGGEEEPLSRCEAEGVTPTEYFRVVTRDGSPVFGAQVQIETEGAIELISSVRPLSDEQGLVPVRVSCPRTMPDRAVIKASLPGLQQEKHIYVRLEVQRIDRLRLLPDAPGQRFEDLGRAQAGEPIRFKVIAEDSRGNPAAQSRLDLSVAVTQASNRLYRLQGGECVFQPEQEIDGTSVYTDADGIYRFEVCGSGLSTLVRPMGLTIRAYGQTSRLVVPIVLLPGSPERVLTNPPERIVTTVGGSGGALEVIVSDGAGNGIPGASVVIEGPPSVLFSRSTGLTTVLGRFQTWIVRVDEEGEHTVPIRVTTGEVGSPEYFSREIEVIVAAGQGSAVRLALYRNGLPMLAMGGAVPLDIGVGTQLARPVVARLENREGGGLPGVGIAVDLIEGDPDDCGRIGIDQRVTDESGEIQFGGEAGVLFEAGTRLGDCVWRLSAGNAVFTNLRVQQVAGEPFGGQPILELLEGEVGELISLQSSPRDWDQGLPSIATVRVRAEDRFGNPVERLRMWLDASNCWIEERVQVLGPHAELGLASGEGFWRVAGGRDHQSPCVLTMSYGGDWAQAEALEIPIIGLPSPQIDWIDKPSFEGRTCDDRGNGCSDREHCVGRFCYERGPHYFMSNDPFGAQELVLRIDPALIIRPQELAAQVSGTCFEAPEDELGDPYARCSHVEWMEAEPYEEQVAGETVTRFRYATITRLPIHWRTRGNQAEFYVEIPNEFVRAARLKGIRIRQPDGHTAGPVEQVYVRPPVTWERQRTVVVGPEGNDDVRLRSGYRLQLDEDEALETIVCGDDPSGGIVGVINPAAAGQAPDEVVAFRTWRTGESGNLFPRPHNSRLACTLGDLNGDGRKDLVVATGVSNQERLPRLVLLKAITEPPFFDFENSVTITLNEAVGGAPAHQVAFENHPRRILFCQSRIETTRGDCVASRINDQYHGGFGRVEIQADPFTGDPAHAIGVQENLGTLSIHQFQGHPSFKLPGIGWLDSGGHLHHGEPSSGRSPMVHTGARRNMVFRPRDEKILSIDATGTLYKWSQDGRLLEEAVSPFGSDRVGFSHDGELGCAREGALVHLFRTEDEQVIASMEVGAEEDNGFCFFSQDGSTLVAVEIWEERVGNSCSKHQATHVFGTDDGRLRYRTPLFSDRSCGGRAPRVVVNADGSRLVVANQLMRQATGDLTVWDNEGHLLESHEIPGLGAYRLAAPADLSELLVETNHDGGNNQRHLRGYQYPGFAQQWHVPNNLGHAFKNHGFLTTSDGRWHLSGEGAIYDRASKRHLLGRTHQNFGWYSIFGMSQAVQPYSYLSINENNSDRAYELVWLRPLDRTVPMAVLPPYAHGVSTQERERYSEHYPGTWLLHQEGRDGWVGQIKRSYDNRNRNNAFGGVEWTNRVDLVRPTTWRANCGDGITQPDELFDRGQPFEGLKDCGAGGLATCGNGVLDSGEQCDDGGVAGDGRCDRRCQIVLGSRREQALESCADLAETQPAGTYWINPASENPDEAFEAYCVWQGEGPAWTLMMKIDGRKETFAYDAGLWTNDELLNAESPHLDRFEEFKGPGFNRVTVNEMLIGSALSRVPGFSNHVTGQYNYAAAPWPELGFQRKWVSFQVEGDPDLIIDGEPLPVEAVTLQRIFSADEPRGHSMVRETWDQWLEPIRLQAHCNRMGFNVQAGAHRLRIGIIGNDQEDCNSPETWTGIGSNQTEACDWDRYGSYCSRAGYPTTTNSAGAKSYHYGHPRWAYVLVR